jgi:hypothetical protein
MVICHFPPIRGYRLVPTEIGPSGSYNVAKSPRKNSRFHRVEVDDDSEVVQEDDSMIAKFEPVTLADVDTLNAMFEAQRAKAKVAKDRPDVYAARPAKWFVGIRCVCGTLDCTQSHGSEVAEASH